MRRMHGNFSGLSPRIAIPQRVSKPIPPPPGPRPSPGAGDAPARGPLPPQPRHAVCHAGPARTGPHGADHGHRDVPGDGHDLLAPSDRGGAGAGGGVVRAMAMLAEVLALLNMGVLTS